MGRHAHSDLPRLLLVTERAGVRALFDLPGATEPADADVAVVDACPDEHGALDTVRALVEQRPQLPVAALLCCPHSVSGATVRALLAAGARGLLDLHATPAQTRDALAALAHGTVVLHSRLGHGVLRDVVAAQPQLPEVQAQVLGLVAQGLRDREIGERLHLSPHTVKHRVDQLCRTMHARNRIELAAWAGRNGF